MLAYGLNTLLGSRTMVCRLHSSIKCSLSRVLNSFAEERAVGQHHGSPSFWLENADDESQEKVRGLAGLEVLGEVAFDPVFLASAEGRIGENDIDTVSCCIADIRPRQRVVVTDETRVLDAMQEHIGNTEHVRELLFLDGAQRLLHALLILYLFHVTVPHVA